MTSEIPHKNAVLHASSCPPPPKQRRLPITNEQRKLIRDHYRACRSEISQKSIQEYFFNQTGRRLNQSTISEILSPHFAYLDESVNHLTVKRAHHPHWPNLEAALFEWQQ